MPARSIGRLAVLAALVGACVSPSATLPPATDAAEPSASDVERGPILLAGRAMTPCAIGAQSAVCGSLQVREDRSRTDGRMIDVRVAVLSATGTLVRDDP